MAKNANEDWLKAAQKARRALAQAAKACPKAAKALNEASLALKKAEIALAQSELAIGIKRPGRKQGKLKTAYRVTVTASGEPALAESRKGSRQPFRVGRSVYDAAATFLAQSDRPEPFEEIRDAVAKSLDRIIPDYQLRVVIRFWVKMGLVEHRRTRFIAAPPRSKLKSKARELWRSLEKPTQS